MRRGMLRAPSHMFLSFDMELGGFASSSSSSSAASSEQAFHIIPSRLVGRRLLSDVMNKGTGLNTEKVVSFAPGCGKHLAKPNRKREEAVVLENLRKKVEACRLMKAENNSLTSGSPSPSSSTSRSDGGLDNSPRFGVFNKVLSNRSASVPDRETIKQLEPQWERSEFINDCLHYHNVYRQRHGAPPLVLCSQLCLEAQTWANHLAHMNKFYYRNGREIGQNLFCRPMNTLQSDITGQEVTSYWYSSVRFYNYFKEPKILHANVNSGHFTQMIWISTKEFGIGKARSRSGKIIVVAHYRPPGNIPGLFHKNVLPPLPDYDSERTSESGSESSASKNAESCR